MRMTKCKERKGNRRVMTRGKERKKEKEEVSAFVPTTNSYGRIDVNLLCTLS